MSLTMKELNDAHNNIMTVMENHLMNMCGCNRKLANLMANEVLELNEQIDCALNRRSEE